MSPPPPPTFVRSPPSPATVGGQHQHDGSASSVKSHHEASHTGHQGDHEHCSGVVATLDREWDNGFSLTITSQPWRPKLALQLTLPAPGATLQSFTHATLHAFNPTGVSLIADETPGVSLVGHFGAQVQFQGKWRGATAHCAKPCIAAAVVPLAKGDTHAAHASGGHVHGGDSGGFGHWRVSPAVWSPKALVTLHTSEGVTLQRLAHATLVRQNGQELMVRRMPRTSSEGPEYERHALMPLSPPQLHDASRSSSLRDHLACIPNMVAGGTRCEPRRARRLYSGGGDARWASPQQAAVHEL